MKTSFKSVTEEQTCKNCGGVMEHDPDSDWDFLPKPNAFRCIDCGICINVTTIGAPLETIAAAIEETIDETLGYTFVKRMR
jgi:ferredoxin